MGRAQTSRHRFEKRVPGVLFGVVLALGFLFLVGGPSASAQPAPQPEPRIVGPSPRIVGGDGVPEGKYPYVAALLRPAGYYFCGGSVVADRWILTAAHCVTDLTTGVVDVAAGDIYVATGRVNLATTVGEEVVGNAIYVHPNWDGISDGDFAYDFALIELATATTATPIAMATTADLGLYDSPTDSATVMGWGSTATGGGISAVLRETNVPIVSDTYCSTQYADFGYVPAAELCAGAAGHDSCQGDSGGPLVAPPGTTGTKLIGIVSYGFDCGVPGFPGVYAEVVEALPWIESVLNGDICQVLGTTPTVTTTAELASAVSCYNQQIPAGSHTITIGTDLNYSGANVVPAITQYEPSISLTIEGNNKTIAGPGGNGFTDLITVSGAGKVTIKELTLHNSGRDGLHLSFGAGLVELIDSTISDASYAGVYSEGGILEVQTSTIVNTGTYGFVVLYYSTVNVTNSTIEGASESDLFVGGPTSAVSVSNFAVLGASVTPPASSEGVVFNAANEPPSRVDHERDASASLLAGGDDGATLIHGGSQQSLAEPAQIQPAQIQPAQIQPDRFTTGGPGTSAAYGFASAPSVAAVLETVVTPESLVEASGDPTAMTSDETAKAVEEGHELAHTGTSHRSPTIIGLLLCASGCVALAQARRHHYISLTSLSQRPPPLWGRES